ncbi:MULTISPECIES: tyrosine-type recombinase/integrase [unclassified Staphylococcus]|uniref:tyrosine-type recombinase/integrase n=1 Tax=unclassified Staphylococcus TaxID=91994 RepID=UPI0021D05459|nr:MULTISPECIES: tyrosine-type recombinase/integrase [unclassified Staphylococcus]UXR78645.1 tyrosine-type recombinase/integrase [Staphylococcus sp. IVB6227]UXR82804.1 tyrosine-type recombinase/integrase [Staphylococcus sp. IVB6214]
MKCVNPITNCEDIQKMYTFLKTQSQRDYLLFKFAIHTGIKLNELLNLTVSDVMKNQYEVIAHWEVCGSHEIQVVLPETLRQEMKHYIELEKLAAHDLLFQSKRTKKGLSRQQAYRIVHAAAQGAGIPHVGLTTLRKTFAYHTYRSGVSVSIIQKYLGHQTAQETRKFIGVPKEGAHTMIALNL